MCNLLFQELGLIEAGIAGVPCVDLEADAHRDSTFACEVMRSKNFTLTRQRCVDVMLNTEEVKWPRGSYVERPLSTRALVASLAETTR